MECMVETLIVIGILIALQIQNWNEKRLDRIEERYLLEELVDNLNLEAERLEEGLSGISRQLKMVEVIQGYFKDRSYTQEDLETHMRMIQASFSFEPITSAYESMKATEAGFSNRVLKSALVNYYERKQPTLMFNLESHSDFNRREVRPMIIKHVAAHKYRERVVFKDIEDPLLKETILGQTVILENLLLRIRTHVDGCMESNRELLILAEQELEGM